MARPAKFDSDDILDAATALIAESGASAATVTAIAKRVGAPSGSIYHRFESRELLLAHLWLRSVERFQAGFLDALALDDLDAAAVAAVLHAPRWCRAHTDECTVLLLHRREELAATFPAQLGKELEVVNRAAGRALREHAHHRFGTRSKAAFEITTMALVDLPYSLVRRHLAAGGPPPVELDGLLVDASQAVLARDPGP